MCLLFFDAQEVKSTQGRFFVRPCREMYADDDGIDISDATPPSSAAEHAAMALAILGPNHRGNVTFEALESSGEGFPGEGRSSGEEGAGAPSMTRDAGLTHNTPPERLGSSIR